VEPSGGGPSGCALLDTGFSGVSSILCRQPWRLRSLCWAPRGHRRKRRDLRWNCSAALLLTRRHSGSTSAYVVQIVETMRDSRVELLCMNAAPERRLQRRSSTKILTP